MASELTCRTCGGPRSRFSRFGFCRTCARRNRDNLPPPMNPHTHCLDCGKGLCKINVTGYCKPCWGSKQWEDPDFRERRAEGVRRKFADPEYMAKMRKQCQRLGQKTAIDPVLQARRREVGRVMYLKNLAAPEVRQRCLEAVRKAGPKHTELRLGWCPEPFRTRYRYLIKTKKMKAVDARALIEREMADQDALKHIDSALDFLRRLAPVAKLENGYRYGNAILRPSEVIERATLRGWQPERWAA